MASRIIGYVNIEESIRAAAAAFNAGFKDNQPVITIGTGRKAKTYQILAEHGIIGLIPAESKVCPVVTFLSADCKDSNAPSSAEWVIKKLVMGERGVKGEVAASTIGHLSREGFMKLHQEEAGFTQVRAGQVLPHLDDTYLNLLLENVKVKPETAANYLDALLSPVAPLSNNVEAGGRAKSKAVKVFGELMGENVRRGREICNFLKGQSLACLVSGLDAKLWPRLLPGLRIEAVALMLKKAPEGSAPAIFKAAAARDVFPEFTINAVTSEASPKKVSAKKGKPVEETPMTEMSYMKHPRQGESGKQACDERALEQQFFEKGEQELVINLTRATNILKADPAVAADILLSYHHKEMFEVLFLNCENCGDIFNQMLLLIISPQGGCKTGINVVDFFVEILNSQPEAAKSIAECLDEGAAVYLFKKLNVDTVTRTILCECRSRVIEAVIADMPEEKQQLLLPYDVNLLQFNEMCADEFWSGADRVQQTAFIGLCTDEALISLCQKADAEMLNVLVDKTHKIQPQKLKVICPVLAERYQELSPDLAPFITPVLLEESGVEKRRQFLSTEGIADKVITCLSIADPSCFDRMSCALLSKHLNWFAAALCAHEPGKKCLIKLPVDALYRLIMKVPGVPNHSLFALLSTDKRLEVLLYAASESVYQPNDFQSLVSGEPIINYIAEIFRQFKSAELIDYGNLLVQLYESNVYVFYCCWRELGDKQRLDLFPLLSDTMLSSLFCQSILKMQLLYIEKLYQTQPQKTGVACLFLSAERMVKLCEKLEANKVLTVMPVWLQKTKPERVSQFLTADVTGMIARCLSEAEEPYFSQMVSALSLNHPEWLASVMSTL